MENANRLFHQLVSIVFHPLLIVFYLLYIMTLINPIDFISFQGTQKHMLFFQVVVSTLILPGIAIVMLYSLGLISSVELGDSKERMFPFIAAAIFYLWLLANLLYNPTIPKMLVVVVFAAIIGLFLSMVVNLFIKLSIHCLGAASLLSCVLLITYEWSLLFDRNIAFNENSMAILIVLCILIAGLVGNSRLQLKIHEIQEVYTGYIVGLLSPIIAYLTIDFIFYG